MIADLRERIGQLVDGVVADRDGAVAAGIDRLQPVVLRGLLAHLDGLHHELAVSVGASAAALVQREGRGDQSGLFFASHWAPLKAKVVSSPQVNASLMVRFG